MSNSHNSGVGVNSEATVRLRYPDEDSGDPDVDESSAENDDVGGSGAEDSSASGSEDASSADSDT